MSNPSFIFFAALAAATPSVEPENVSTPRTVERGEEARVEPAERIVTLGGCATEIAFALGRGDAVVGTEASSLYPEAVRQLPQVGYFRAISAEGVLSLRPTLVVAVEGSGPPAALAQLRAAGVRIELLPGETTARGVEARIRRAAEVLGVAARGEALVSRLHAELTAAEAASAKVSARPRVLFIYARAGGTLNVAGRETSAAAMIALGGGVNAIDGFRGYRPLTAEAMVAAAPDVLLVTTRGLEALGGAAAMLALPGVALTPAGKAGRVVAMDDLLLLGFGPRTGSGAAELFAKLHPEAR